MIDADVAIDHLRGRAEAIAYLDSSLDELLMCAITVAELYAGYKGADEKAKLDGFVGMLEVVPVTATDAVRGGEYRNRYGKSHGTDLNDAIVAAASESQRAKVVTLNRKHYPMLGDSLVVPYVKK